MRITITFRTELGRELKEAAAACALGNERISPALFAQEAVESVLASRRLPRIAPGRCGARLTPPAEDNGPEPYRVWLPEDLMPASRGWE